MQIYYHCTYKGSPVGFCIGKLNMEGQTAGNIELREENINQFIRNCFNYGTVRKACGVLPQESSKYFLLAKKLTAQGKTPDEPEHYSLNIALVGNKEQFRSWLAKEDDPEQEIAETIKASMEIDRTNDFGFTVRAEQAAPLAEKSFKSLFTGYDPRYAESEIWVETSYTQTDLKQLAEDLELSEPDKEFQKSGSGKWVIYRKKKRTLHNLITAAVEWIKKNPLLHLIAAVAALWAAVALLVGVFRAIVWLVSFMKSLLGR